jgi:uncharacterized protein YdeI (BOF family)
MIHEITDSLFELNLKDYVLTFDDGLYSHFYHFNKFADIDTEKIYFISSGIVCDGQQSDEFPTSSQAHEKAFLGNYEDFMTISQIKELAKQPNVTIGGHGHSHTDLNKFSKMTERIKFVMDDTRQMMAWFSFHIGYCPTAFCYPYNNDMGGLYKGILTTYGFTDFYGKERISA